MKLSGHTALVTGASAGIGKAFALELAARGADLVLTARRRDRLDVVAHEITRRYDRQVAVIAADLADPHAPDQLADEVARRGLHVSVLVNNAGYGLPGFFRTHAWREHADSIQVMVTAVAHLTHLFLPEMLTRRFGQIVNVASVAGLLPGAPTHTLYGACKSFLIKFSESLATEVGQRGVNVTALCPGFTYSEFHDVAGTRSILSKLPRWMWMDAERVARQGLDAVARGEIVYVNGLANRAVASFWKLMPEAPALDLMRRNARRVPQTHRPAPPRESGP